MVVREDTGRFLTTRQEPRISLVTPSLPPEALTVNSSEELPSDASLGTPSARTPSALPFTCHVLYSYFPGNRQDPRSTQHCTSTGT